MAERAGYTLTMFLIDTSPSMGKLREVELPPGPDGQRRRVEITNLEFALQFVKLKVQEMIYNGRKTDQCGVILFGTEETKNIINGKAGGYEHVTEYIPIGQPNSETLTKISELEPSTEVGDPVDAIIVGVETQDRYLGKKKWARRIVMITDGENPIEIEDWEATIAKMNQLKIKLSIVGVDFDDDEMPFHEDDKSNFKRANEEFFHMFASHLEDDRGVVGNCEFALSEISRPDIRQVKSSLMPTELRLGDTENHPDESIKIFVKSSKCTAIQRPKSFKKFAIRRAELMMEKKDKDDMKQTFVQLKLRSECFGEDEEKMARAEQQKELHPELEAEDDEENDTPEQALAREKKKRELLIPLEKEDLVRGYKYGSDYVPVEDANFPRLPTKKGIDICGFFKVEGFKRDLAMNEVQYIFADPSSSVQQLALSSIIKAMNQTGCLAIARWVSRDGMDPKMGVLSPTECDNVDCFLWVQMPFADDVRKYTFASLDKLISKKGERITNHPYLPTQEQNEAMENFVDAMDLMEAGEKNEDSERRPWYDTRLSYNPAIHRMKQAQFHAAVVPDLNTNPLPPPHPELLKYFNTPRRVLKHAKNAIEECKTVFDVKEVPKRVTRARKEEHVRAEDDEMLLLDQLGPRPAQTQKPARTQTQLTKSSSESAMKVDEDDSATEPEEEDEPMLLDQQPPASTKLSRKVTPPASPPQLPPTPSQSQSPEPRSSSPPMINAGIAPGRIIGSAFPLEDFKKNIASGDLVTKAVQDLGAVIREIVMAPFSDRRYAEMIKCMKELRKVALEEDEIDAWNEFLTELKTECVDEDPGNEAFWDKVVDVGRKISLISQTEAEKLGGKSDVSETRASQFVQK
ncbi:ATP-dependent DNA helicase II subunit 2 [Abortiporus biennis]